MSSSYRSWDRVYHEYPLGALPWELGKPRPVLVQVVEEGLVEPCKALDICCGAGTKTVYMAEEGFQATGLNVSHKAIEYGRKKEDHVKSLIFQSSSFPRKPCLAVFEHQGHD